MCGLAAGFLQIAVGPSSTVPNLGASGAIAGVLGGFQIVFPRDRILVTVSALIASGQVAQIAYHLNRAMDNGLTQPQASEVLTHLAFYAGWPNVFSALPVAKEVFEKRPK
jgi:membrane associated rhomboid family serine protease